jgi:hypothetical protein
MLVVIRVAVLRGKCVSREAPSGGDAIRINAM